jgi:hypothetical protein
MFLYDLREVVMDFVTWVLQRFDAIMAEAQKKRTGESQPPAKHGPEGVRPDAPDQRDKRSSASARAAA